ncbi:unnamed protein product [Staurois parvus]|uniref:Uncharacterized protein n=1 Tax=Staurois parvus TaxID=386267 RepID=A0ABN9ADC2_9NEOB|nr:unnamed protein product [Staurois parvus]
MISLWHSVITEYYQWGKELYVNDTVLSPISSCTLLCMALHNRAVQSSVLTVESTQHTMKQHTVNPLITPHINLYIAQCH